MDNQQLWGITNPLFMKEHHLLKKYCPYKFIYALLLVASES